MINEHRYLGIIGSDPEGDDLQLGETRGHTQHLQIPGVDNCFTSTCTLFDLLYSFSHLLFIRNPKSLILN